MMWKIITVVLTVIFAVAEGYRILGLFAHPGKSHYMVFSPIMKGLAHRGHNVTVVSYFPEESSIPNYTDLTFDKEEDLTEHYNISMYTTLNIWIHFRELFELAEWGKMTCEQALFSKVIDDVLSIHKADPFDLVITEFFDTDCLLGVVHLMDVPFIGLSSCVLMPWHYDRVATPDTPSFIATEFVEYPEKMTYLQRFESFFLTKSTKFLYRYLVQWSDNEMLKRKFGPGIPDVAEIAKETSLLFVNQHFSVHQPRPLAANLIEIGGIHIQKEKPLPENLQRLLDSSKQGVVIMSWGSMVNTSTMHSEVVKIFVDVFRGLEETVIWKWEGKPMANKPNNVFLVKWLPQRDILCHPNVKVFLSHAGNLGMTEAVHCGVPVVSTPFYGDQPLNGNSLEYRGMGVQIKYEDLSVEAVRKALEKMFTKKVQNTAKEISKAFKDRPMSALDTALYWVEYTIRTKGVFIKSHARNMNWITYHSLDIILPIILVFSFIFYVLTRIIVTICHIGASDSGKFNEKQKKN